MNDSVGSSAGALSSNAGGKMSNRQQARAHAAAVNGLAWTENGDSLVSAGHDERIRVWDMLSGANTLVNFGPLIRNTHLATTNPLLVPAALLGAKRQVMLFPSETETFVFNLLDGELLARMRVPPAATHLINSKVRITSLAWRAHAVEYYSAHTDGTIRCWSGYDTDSSESADDSELERPEQADRKRKRQVLDDIYRDLTERKVTFT